MTRLMASFDEQLRLRIGAQLQRAGSPPGTPPARVGHPLYSILPVFRGRQMSTSAPFRFQTRILFSCFVDDNYPRQPVFVGYRAHVDMCRARFLLVGQPLHICPVLDLGGELCPHLSWTKVVHFGRFCRCSGTCGHVPRTIPTCGTTSTHLPRS
jgi:hypothetical protein